MEARLSFIDRPLPPAFALRVVVVGAGDERPYDESEWHDALVVVERGQIDLDTLAGASLRCRAGAVLWLTGLPLRALANRGPGHAVIAAVTKR